MFSGGVHTGNGELSGLCGVASPSVLEKSVSARGCYGKYEVITSVIYRAVEHKARTLV